MLSKTNRICYTPLPTEASTFPDQPTIHAYYKLGTSCDLEGIRDIRLLLLKSKAHTWGWALPPNTQGKLNIQQNILPSEILF